MVDPQAVFDRELARLRLMDGVAASKLQAAHRALMAEAAARGNGQKSLVFDPQADADEDVRKNHRHAILSLLRRRGSGGATNIELNDKICLRYGARIFELRRDGFTISTVREGRGVYRFVLVS